MCDLREEFEEILCSECVRSDAPNEEYQALIDPIIQFIIHKTPSSLFRYRSCNELNFDAFDKNEVWAVSPSMFNDPYDSLPFIDKEWLFNVIKEQTSVDSIKSIWKYAKQHNTLPDEPRNILGKKATKQIVENLRKINISELVKQIRSNPTSDEQFRINIDHKWDEIRDGARNTNKIASFSEVIDSVTMWAHYADYHKGFALEYNLKEGVGLVCDRCSNKDICNNRSTANIYPVIYKSQQFDATGYVYDRLIQESLYMQKVDFTLPLGDCLFFPKMFLHKHNSWGYEKEWRLLCCSQRIHEHKTVAMAIKQPVAIYYGSRISPIHKKILHAFALEKGIKEYQMQLDDNKNDYTLIQQLIE